MSEVISTPEGTVVVTSSGTTVAFGLEVTSESPVTITESLDKNALSTLGSLSGDSFAPLDPSDTRSLEVFGEGGDDTIAGGSGSDLFFGGTGLDILSGAEGSDTLFGGFDGDTIFGGESGDYLSGDEGGDRLFGEAGNDTIVGGPGADIMIGGDGDDVLMPGSSSELGRGFQVRGRPDTLVGGGGADTFVFHAGSTGPRSQDLIQDFNPAEDTILLSRKLLPGARLRLGTLRPSDFAVVNKLDQDNNLTATLIYEQKTGILYYNPRKGADVALMRLPKGLDDISNTNIEIFSPNKANF